MPARCGLGGAAAFENDFRLKQTRLNSMCLEEANRKKGNFLYSIYGISIYAKGIRERPVKLVIFILQAENIQCQTGKISFCRSEYFVFQFFCHDLIKSCFLGLNLHPILVNEMQKNE